MQNLESYILLLKSFENFFSRQSKILMKEIKIVKAATEFYKKESSKSQENEELKIIYAGVLNLKKKAENIKELFIIQENIKDKHDTLMFNDLINSIKSRIDNSHITILVIIDSLINEFKNLFDELNFYKQSYFNLIDSKEFPYIPFPKFNKRFRNANLGLFLNKQLNDTKKENSYRYLIQEFFEKNNFAENINEFKNYQFFATWNYSTDHYIKNFVSTKQNEDLLSIENKSQRNIYISMSYTYLDKAILQPIAYHEIAHAIKHKKLSIDELNYLNLSLKVFENKNILKKDNTIDDLYKEILCDFSAFYAVGYSYIISLIHIGFFELTSLFDIEPYIFDPNKNLFDFFTIKRNEDISPLEFDFKTNNIFLAVRILLLIKLSDELKIESKYIEGIKEIINIIFPENNMHNNQKYITFQNIYEFIYPNGSTYEISKNLVYSLSSKFEEILFTDALIENFKERKKDKTLDEFTERLPFIINKEEKTNSNQCKTIYDFLWQIRENNSEFHEKHISRFFNIYSLLRETKLTNENGTNILQDIFNKFSLSNNETNNLFYDLELIKYRATKSFHPLLEYMKDRKEEKYLMGYIFAPYDICVLRENSNGKFEYPFTEKNLQTGEEKRFFVDRHSLFLLNEIKSINKERIFDILIQIKINDIFSETIVTNTYEKLYVHFNDKKTLYDNCKIFKSLGGEDFLVYLSGIDIEDSSEFGKSLKLRLNVEDKIINEIEDFIIINKNATINKNLENLKMDDKRFEIISSSKIDPEYRFQLDKTCIDLVDNLILPIEGYEKIKIPTNRFDCIINWEVNNRPFTNILNYLKKVYDENKSSQFIDINIELMHILKLNNK